MKYKYKMADIDCDLCENRGSANCINDLCPCIMSNLSELITDVKFREAIKNADNCNSFHRNTLKHLRKQAIKYGYDIFYEDKPFRREYKSECEKCNYASPGFICYSKNDGTCLKDWIRSIYHAGSK